MGSPTISRRGRATGEPKGSITASARSCGAPSACRISRTFASASSTASAGLLPANQQTWCRTRKPSPLSARRTVAIPGAMGGLQPGRTGSPCRQPGPGRAGPLARGCRRGAGARGAGMDRRPGRVPGRGGTPLMLPFPYQDEPLSGPPPPSLPGTATVRWRPLVPATVVGTAGGRRFFPRALRGRGADDTILPLALAGLLGVTLRADSGHQVRWRGQSYALRFGDVVLELSDGVEVWR